MEEYFDILSQCPLFAGISQEELKSLLSCLDGKIIKTLVGTICEVRNPYRMVLRTIKKALPTGTVQN